MAATRANLEPIFLVYDGAAPHRCRQLSEAAAGDQPTAAEVIDRVAGGQAPLLTVQTEDGITHRLWRIDDEPDLAAIETDLACRRALIADGHHRYAAYLELRDELRATGNGPGPWDYGLAYLVDSAAYPVRLGAIHRVLPRLPQHRAAELAKAAFTVDALPQGTDLAAAQDRLAEAGRHGAAFLLAGPDGFHLLTHPDPVQAAASMPSGSSAAWQLLDAAILQQLLLDRLWGIPDSNPAVQISHDAAEATAAVRAGGTAVLVNPVQFDAVRAIAEHGERVPRKSTSFGPKPRTGLVLRTFSRPLAAS
jgi:uncharacterized protein (DUF1015 family)